MTHFQIRLYGSSDTSNYSSRMTRTVEAVDLECAAKQAAADLQTMRRIFSNLTWRLDFIEEVQQK